MDEHNESLMAQYGITAETKVLFHLGGYRYDRLDDAVRYAKAQQGKHKAVDTLHDSGDNVD